MSTRIPKELRDAIKETARRKNMTSEEFITRTLAAAVKAEGDSLKPGFLEAWEKFLTQFKRS